MKRGLVSALCITAVMLTMAATSSAGGRAGLNDPSLAGLTPGYDSQRAALAHAREIRAEVDARYRRPRGLRLAVTEASTTGVIDSFTLFGSGMEMPRVVPAANGIYFAVCPVRATCPYPGRRFARSPAAFAPRRAALELAVRTFLEASALRDALAGDPASAPDVWLQSIVDEMTLPRLFAPWALAAVSETRETLVATCLWPNSP